jgi:hypothetical protein
MRLHRIALLAGLACIALPPLAAAEDDLALKRVMLSTGGVGYFEYEATVTGDATLSLPVRLDQVDDVLKSVIVFDDTGGVGTISLPGREPLRDVFRELPFSEAELATPVALLNALRGAEIETLGVRAISGRLLSVTPEQVVLPDGGGTLTRHRLSILTDDGVRQVVLEDADAVRFRDPDLQADIDAALAAVARHGERDRRILDLRATGEGSACCGSATWSRRRCGKPPIGSVCRQGRRRRRQRAVPGLGGAGKPLRRGLGGRGADRRLGPSGHVSPGPL